MYLVTRDRDPLSLGPTTLAILTVVHTQRAVNDSHSHEMGLVVVKSEVVNRKLGGRGNSGILEDGKGVVRVPLRHLERDLSFVEIFPLGAGNARSVITLSSLCVLPFTSLRFTFE